MSSTQKQIKVKVERPECINIEEIKQLIQRFEIKTPQIIVTITEAPPQRPKQPKKVKVGI
jgi:hypothetical protein